MKNLLFVLACLLSFSLFGQGACNNQSSITHQGYEYAIVEIGDQCWFSENCRYLPEVSLSSERSETEPHYYVYRFAGSTVSEAKATTNYESYGVMYNWPAVMTEGVCPTGWHIPSDGEFTELTDFLGGQTVAGGKMKEAGYDHWSSPNTDATNSSGFTCLPGGYATSDGPAGRGEVGFFWSTSESDYDSDGDMDTWFLMMTSDSRTIFTEYGTQDCASSARCVRD
tara:strand:- start:58 stop:732 length:675 start_codon:yes stop_codon:yes gene_type:complete